MRLDALNEFCDATAVAQTADANNRVLLGNVIDLGVDGLDLGCTDMYLVIQTDTEIITGGSAGTIKFHLVSDAIEAIHVTTSTVHITSPTYVTDDAAANSDQLNAGGVILACKLPHGVYERYLGVAVQTITTDTTAGKINAFLTPDYSAFKAYADGL